MWLLSEGQIVGRGNDGAHLVLIASTSFCERVLGLAVVGCAVYAKSDGQLVYALNAHTGTLPALSPAGRVIRVCHVGGRFGIADPVMVGGIVYLANLRDWPLASPARSGAESLIKSR
ncbi:MAG: hypothetical protein ACYDB1_04895 [Acidiferrobacteraceae bacterium]